MLPFRFSLQAASRPSRFALILNSRRAMSTTPAPLLVTPQELGTLLKSTDDVVTLDATWFMPNVPRNALTEFQSKRLPHARYLDLDAVASAHPLGLKHMMPDGQTFSAACAKIGIRPSSRVVIYDSHGIFSAPRALFMFRAFGHQNSSVLNGGLPGWETEGLPVETSAPEDVAPLEPAPEVGEYDQTWIKNYEEMVANSQRTLEDGVASLVVDARPGGRFSGKDPEPRPGLSSGHIPHSFSLPFVNFLQVNKIPNSDKTYPTFLEPAELKKNLIAAVGEENMEAVLSGKRTITTTCGSGMTAGVLWLGLKLLGAEHVSLYDESWTGYATRKESQIEKDE